MSQSGPLYLLDTNIVVHYVRGNEVAERVEAKFGLRALRDRPLMSIVSTGELRALATRLGWGEPKIRRLDEMLRELVVVDISSREVVEAFGDISAWTESSGLKMGQQNDIWIAATARATGAHLITADRDFDVLHPKWIQRTFVDPASALT